MTIKYFNNKIVFLSAILMVNISTLTAQNTDNSMIINALKYLETPYVPHVLDNSQYEQLIVNKQEVDCTTLVEYVLSESLSGSPLNTDSLSEEDFLTRIRYRNGIISGYPSRLHYASEWIQEGVKNNFLKDITSLHSADKMYVVLSYMSMHPNFYKQLQNSPENLAAIKQIEKDASGQVIRFLPKDKLPPQGLFWIKDGDIICFTVGIRGLDISHMGIAHYQNNQLHLLHASYPHAKVLIDPLTVSEMLKKNKNWTGIRVLRPNM